jgi:DNA-binding LacI/PurR family transcriptional regulator
VSLGRHRIAFIGAHPDVHRQPAHLRLHGYQEALAAAGLPFDPALAATTPQFGRGDGLVAMRRLLALDQPPNAVFAYNDLIAIGAIRAMHEAGVRVPQDVAIIGFDDIDEGRFATPTLTTISPDKDAIGKLAVTSLIARVEDKQAPEPGDVQTPFRLVIRESTMGKTP